MSTADKVVVILCVFGGFLWLRARARKAHPERHQVLVLVGIFMVLPALLVGESRLFQHLPYGPATNLLLKASILLCTFAVIGFCFLRPAPSEESSGTAPDSGDRGQPTQSP